MQSRRDQVQAQSYVTGRLTSALIAGDPELLEHPNRRWVSGAFVGLMVAALLVAGFTVFGFIIPGGSTKWRDPGTLIVEKETGSRYVLVDGRLRPVLNYASAMLLFGRTPDLVSVSRSSLRGAPHGQPLGVVGAPDVLPDTATLRPAGWRVCAVTGHDDTGAVIAATTVALVPSPAAQPDDRPLGDRAIVATTDHHTMYLIWHGHRFRLDRPWLDSVFGDDGRGTLVQAGWLDALPAGPDIAPVPVPGRGQPGPQVDGHASVVGQVLVEHVAGAADRHYLLRRDGLSLLDDTAYAMALADPDTATAYGSAPVGPLPLSVAAAAQLPRSPGDPLPAGLPTAAPALADPGVAWCALQPVSSVDVTIAQGRPVGAADVVQPGLAAVRTARTAAAVSVFPGAGGLVQAGRADQAGGGSFYLLTDAGLKYPIAGGTVAAKLGYPTSVAVAVPQPVLDLLPTGPLLDPSLIGG